MTTRARIGGHGIGRDVGVVRRLVGARIRSELEYRVSFGAFLVAQGIVTFLDCVAILLLFSKVHTIGGWDRSQVLYLYGTATMSFGTADLLFGALQYTPEYVRTGDLDRLLVRPLPIVAQLFGGEFALRRLGRVLQSVVVLVAVLTAGTLHVAWTPAKLAVMAFAIGGGVLTYGSLWLAATILAFYSPGADETANAVTYGGQTVAQYPTHVFGPALRRTALFVVPVGAISYLPAIFVLDAPNPLRVPAVAQVLAPLVFLPVGTIAALLWRTGIRHYEGTGS